MLDDLYDGRSVRLVDGGVCDNQGVGSLLEQDCTVLLVSDACGQMGAEDHPSGILGVPLRSNSILQARVREALYHDVAARRRAEVLRGLMFIHLNQGITAGRFRGGSVPPTFANPSSRASGTGRAMPPATTSGWTCSGDSPRSAPTLIRFTTSRRSR